MKRLDVSELSYVFLRFEENEYTCHRSNRAHCNRCSYRIESPVQSVENQSGQDKHGNKGKYHRYEGRSNDIFVHLVFCVMPMVHFLFGHFYNALCSTWHNLIIFSQRLRLRKRTGIVMLLDLESLGWFVNRVCTFHRRVLCHFRHCTNLLSYYQRRLCFDVFSNVSQ